MQDDVTRLGMKHLVIYAGKTLACNRHLREMQQLSAANRQQHLQKQV